MKNKYFDGKYIPAKYIARFFSWNSAPDLLERKIFPNIKEIAESMSMFNVVENMIFNWDDDIKQLRKENDVTVVVVGDGHSPRTAAIFCYLTGWNVISIDPEMRKTDWDIQRLTCYNKRVEEVENMNFGDKPVIIIYPHSHAPVQIGWDKFQSTRKWLIKMECCTKDKLNLPYYSFRDEYAITKANQIFIWSNYKKLDFI